MSDVNIHLPPPWLPGELLPLPSEKAHHALHVQRLCAGATVRLIDGEGNFTEGVFEPTGKRDAGVRVLGEPRPAPATHAVDLILALPRHETMDTVIRQACELGVARLHPVISERTIVPARVARQKSGHWNKVMIAACQQSGRARFLEIAPARPLDEVLAQDFGAARRLFFWEEAPAGYAPWNVAVGQPVIAAVGPEGGWSAQEAAAFVAAGFTTHSLGDLILRVDTAVTTILAIAIHQLNTPRE